MPSAFDSLIQSVRACDLCASELPLGPRPVLQVNPSARILIAGQAPGQKVHETGIPFDDASGNRLREWMGIDRAVFYDASKVAILPMGFCYPGKSRGGDAPPIPRCAETWRQRLLGSMQKIQLTLLIGRYAQDWHLERQSRTLTENVRNWQEYGQSIIPLPHPSPRNNIWLSKNPWFADELVPVLRNSVAKTL